VDDAAPGVRGLSASERVDLDEPVSPFGAWYTSLSRVLTEPAGRYAMVQCYVLREKDRWGTRYDLYLELPPYHALYCMSARKQKAARTSLFRIAIVKEGGDPGSAAYLGKLKAMDMGGLDWTLYTPGASPLKGGGGGGGRGKRASRKSGDEGGHNDEEDEDAGEAGVRQELLAIRFDKSILGSGGPTQLHAVLPTESEEGGRAVFRPRAKEETIVERHKGGRKTGLVDMSNKLPTWNERLQSYTLEYNGRATEPSVKNIQLVEAQESHDIKFQLGKVGSDRFNVDYKRPYSALQAFAIAVAVMDDKMFCSPAPPALRTALSIKDRFFRGSS